MQNSFRFCFEVLMFGHFCQVGKGIGENWDVLERNGIDCRARLSRNLTSILVLRMFRKVRKNIDPEKEENKGRRGKLLRTTKHGEHDNILVPVNEKWNIYFVFHPNILPFRIKTSDTPHVPSYN